jgi:hypothetical protein
VFSKPKRGIDRLKQLVMDIDYTNCDSFVPFSQYDWTFERKGWLKWKYVLLIQSLPLVTC